jgi:hypothetical protein
MTHLVFLLAAVIVSAAPGAQTFKPSINPVTDAMRERVGREAKNLVAAAESMPADKYGYRPTPEQMTFSALIAHVALTNVALCSALTTAPPPMAPDELKKLSAIETKEPLVAAIRQSVDYCTQALAKATDAQLAGEATVFGRAAGGSLGSLLVTLAVDWGDHYSTAAAYLRLNGILPPTAQPKK